MNSNKSIVWLHLSDLHFCEPKTSWDSHRVLDPLIKDIKKMENDHNLKPDMVFFTGDATYGKIKLKSGPGWDLDDQYKQVAHFLDKIRTAFSHEVEKKNLFLVPGNHDVDRSEVTDPETFWLDAIKNRDEIDKLIAAAEKPWRRYMERLEKYRNFIEHQGYTHLLDDPQRLIYAHILEINRIKIGIGGFNSAWSCCREDENGKLWMGGNWQNGEIIRQLKKRKAQIYICLMHHPFNWFTPYESASLPIKFENDFHVILHGHEHRGWVDAKADGRFRVAAGACYERSDKENGYNFVRLDLEKNQAEIWLRKYDNISGWIPHIIDGKTDRSGCWLIDKLPWLQDLNGIKTDEPSDIDPKPDKPCNGHGANARTAIDGQDSVLLNHLLFHDYQGSASKFFPYYVPLAAKTIIHTATNSEHPWPKDFDHPAFTKDSCDGIMKVELNDVLDAFKHHRQFYLVGEPGSGKSLTLRAFELKAACKFLKEPYMPFPLYLDLSTWLAEKEDFDKLVDDELKKIGLKILARSSLLLLIDGLADSAATRTGNPLQQVEDWLNNHRRCNVVIAARSQTNLSTSLPIVRIEKIDDKRIEAFVNNFAESRQNEVLEWIGWNRLSKNGTRDILPLAKNPFNIRNICLLPTKNDFPLTQGHLIKEVVKATYERESNQKHAKNLSFSEFLNSLCKIAIGMLENRAQLSAHIEWLQNLSRLGEKLDILLSCADNCAIMRKRPKKEVYEFTHRLYIDYFVAEYIMCNSEGWEKYLSSPNYNTFGQRIAQRFDESIHFLINLEGTTDHIKKIAKKDPLFASDCVSSLSSIIKDRYDITQVISKNLITLLGDSDPVVREAVIPAIVKIGKPSIPLLLYELQKGKKWVRRSVVRILTQIGDIDAIEGVVHALDDKNRWVRNEARSAIHRLSYSSPEKLITTVQTRMSTWKDDHGKLIVKKFSAVVKHDHPLLLQAIKSYTGIEIEEAHTKKDLYESDENLLNIEYQEVDKDKNAISWGFSWLAERQQDIDNLELVEQGQVWLRSAPYNDPAWGRVWTSLWRTSQKNRDLEWLGLDWLYSVPNHTDSWSHIWWPLYEARTDDNLAQVGLNWLKESEPDQIGWSFVWKKLWIDSFEHSVLESIGMEFLNNSNVENDNWGVVWSSLFESRSEDLGLEDMGRKWIAHAPSDNPSWGFVWPKLWERNTGEKELIDAAMIWLKSAPIQHKAWGFIWPKLWNHIPNDLNLEQLGRYWLKTVDADNSEWGFIWEPLWEKNFGDIELESEAQLWLNVVSSSHGAWSIVWVQLWKFNPEDKWLLNLGRRWLQQVDKNHSGWGFVFPIIMKEVSGDPYLIALGQTFFDTISSKHGSWASVWKSLWDHGGDHVFLNKVGRKWLKTVGLNDGGFSFVCERLWLDTPVDIELQRMGLTWFKSHINDPTWYNFWSKLLQNNPGDSSLLNIGYYFLDQASRDHRFYGAVWSSLWENGGDRIKLRKFGCNFPKFNDQYVTSFKELEQILGDHPEDKELFDSSLNYLMNINPLNFHWVILWNKLAESGLEKSTIIELGHKWINNHQPNQPGWGIVWKKLLSQETANNELLSRGWEWMKHPFFRRSTWLEVWRVLWKHEIGKRHRLARLLEYWLQYKEIKPEVIENFEEVKQYLSNSIETKSQK